MDGQAGISFFLLLPYKRGANSLSLRNSNVNLCWVSLETVDHTGKGHQVCKYNVLIIHEVIRRIVQNARSLSFA